MENDDNTLPKGIEDAMVAYITSVCSAAVADLKLSLMAYHTKHTEGNVSHHVIKYPLPGSAFLMVIQRHQNDNLFEVVSGCTLSPFTTQSIIYCIGDITTQYVPPETVMGHTFPIELHRNFFRDFTELTIFNNMMTVHEHDDPNDDGHCAWRYNLIEGQLREGMYEMYGYETDEEREEHAHMDKQRWMQHFEDICKLCIKFSPPALALFNPYTVWDSMNTTQRLAKFNLMFSGGTFSPFGKRVLHSGLKDAAVTHHLRLAQAAMH